MPVAIRLSKRLSEKLGDEAANELVEWFNSVDAAYRADIREFNELSFARFDAKLEQRLAEFGAEIRIEMSKLEKSLVRWMFVFWIGSWATMIGSLLALRQLGWLGP